ncbi:Fic family protein [Candidatus Micrarchaeota archaeon]|nr:Fic family protein [Candidatus Micrarchaeota archaeon]
MPTSNYAFKPGQYDNPAGTTKLNSKNQPTFYPKPLPKKLEFDQDLIVILDRATRKVSELSGAAMLLPNPKLLINPYMIKEATDSSKIEGTQSDISDVRKFQSGREPKNRADAQEVDNHFKALIYGLEIVKKEGLTTHLIQEMHKILLDGTDIPTPDRGAFKMVQNFHGPTHRIEDADFIFAAPELVDQLMQEFEQYANRDQNMPLLVQAALIHYQFETIHPFTDGNGRIGRALIPLFLVKNDVLSQPLLYVSPYLKKFKTEYENRMMGVRQTGDFRPWLEFFLTAVEAQSEYSLTKTKKLLELRQQYITQLRKSKASATSERILDEFFQNIICTIPEISKKLGHGFQTVQRHIERDLEPAGIVKEVSGMKKYRIYLATEILGIIQDD